MRKALIFLITVLSLALAPAAIAQSDDETVVRAVLFYSPTCPHCHQVIQELLLPMMDEYGDRLQILGVNVSEEQGQYFYQLAIEHYQIPQNRLGVPTLVIDDVVLVGSGEIPAKFPQMVKDGLAAGGTDWPGIPGLAEAMAVPPAENNQAEPSPPPAEQVEVAPPAAEEPAGQPAEPAQEAAPPVKPQAPAPTESQPALSNPTPAPVTALSTDNTPAAETPPPSDPIGITLAAFVLAGMLAALAYAVWGIIRSSGSLFQFDQNPPRAADTWIIPLFSLVGLAIAGYLAYVEINHVEAVCGPVGECNVVQSSPYAQIFGIPVAVLGILNYVAVLGLWLLYHFSGKPLTNLSLLGLLALTFIGTLFSVYLTLLEIFVIQAICIWCISSAIITTLLLLFIVTSLRLPSSRQPALA